MSVLVHPRLEQRRSPRLLVYSAGRIRQLAKTGAEHVAWVKDINTSGLCLFTRFRPRLGAQVRVTLESDPTNHGRAQQYTGTVVRVQEFGSQAALSVAVQFNPPAI